MATPPNNDTKVLFKLLADHEWHSYYEIRDAIARMVSPGRALRKYEEGVSFRRRYKHGDRPDYSSSLSEAERIEYGARSCAQITITSWRRAGALLQRGERADRQIRVRPDFTSWGIPGFEPVSRQDPAPEEAGVPDLPGDGSGPSESGRESLEEASLSAVMASWAADEGVGGDPTREVAQADPQGDWILADPATPPVGSDDPVLAVGGVPVPPDSPLACEVCGLAVGDRAQHGQWHESRRQPETPPELSLLDESQLKDLLSKALVDVLDPFQENLEGWLAVRFAEVERQIRGLRRGYWRWTSTDES